MGFHLSTTVQRRRDRLPSRQHCRQRNGLYGFTEEGRRREEALPGRVHPDNTIRSAGPDYPTDEGGRELTTKVRALSWVKANGVLRVTLEVQEDKVTKTHTVLLDVGENTKIAETSVVGNISYNSDPRQGKPQ